MGDTLITLYEQLVNHFGSQQKTAEALKVSQPSVSYWVSGQKNMSELVAIRAQAKTEGKFKAIELCPSLKMDLEKLIA